MCVCIHIYIYTIVGISTVRPRTHWTTKIKVVFQISRTLIRSKIGLRLRTRRQRRRSSNVETLVSKPLHNTENDSEAAVSMGKKFHGRS